MAGRVRGGSSGYADRYRGVSSWLRRHPRCVQGLRWATTLLTVVFYGAYGVLLLWAVLGDPWKLVPLVGVVGAAFGLLSWYRRRHDAPRPYELYDIEPLVPRDGAGRSFPSRHAFSAFAIASAWWAASAPVALALEACALALAVLRVIGGVHFVRDVVAGGCAGVAAGLVAALIAGAL